MKRLNNLISAFSAKPLILLFFFTLLPTMASAQISINETTFPDKNFRNWVLAQDYGQDGLLTEEEIARVTKIEILNKGISNLKGIESFTALINLNCENNPLTSFDVSKNTALERLDCQRNGLITLDISKNTSLTILYCGQNRLSSLDVSMNTLLTILSCGFNQLTSLDVSKNTALLSLECHYNLISSLDVSNNKELKELMVHENQLTSLDVSQNTVLTELYCDKNQLSSLDLSGNTKLKTLFCESNRINEKQMGKLVASLPCVSDGYFCPFNVTDINEQNVINTIQVSAAKAKGWKVSAYNGAGGIDYEGCDPTEEGIAIDKKNFPDENFRNWVLAQDYGQDGVLTEEEVAAVISIDVRRKGIADLKGIEYFTALKTLSCYDNQLTSLDVSQNTALTGLYCSGNQLTSLDVSTNTELRWLGCHYNQLTSLDVSQNLVLTDLSCNNNQLTSLDVSKNTALTKLNCGENQLTSLDVSKNTTLKELSCYKNQIKGAVMDALIAGLPDTMGNFFIEQNEVTKTQVAAAKEKGWTTYYWNYELSCWEEYEGSDPEIAPVDQGETIDIGTELDENTNLDGNVVGDVYYCISSDSGSYDPEEGCLVVTKPTEDSAIDGKDIFGEDFKAGYTGFMFMVAPGKGNINVEAETTGNMVLKVKVGDNTPTQMEVNGKTKVSFSYDVSEPTMVFIYGSIAAAGAKGMMKAAGTDALKIYGIEVTSETDGIEDIKNERLKMNNSPVYNLNGQRVESSKFKAQSSKLPKGIYIQNGKKVLVK